MGNGSTRIVAETISVEIPSQGGTLAGCPRGCAMLSDRYGPSTLRWARMSACKPNSEGAVGAALKRGTV